MNATDAIFTLVIAALIALLGVLLFTGHATGLIAGYNTLSEEERARYDKRALGRFMGRVMFVVAGCLCLFAASDIWPGNGLFGIGLTLLVATLVFAIYRANSGDRFLKK